MPSVPETLKLTPIVGVNVTDDTLTVDLQDGRTISVPIGWYPLLQMVFQRNVLITKSAERVMESIYSSSTTTFLTCFFFCFC